MYRSLRWGSGLEVFRITRRGTGFLRCRVQGLGFWVWGAGLWGFRVGLFGPWVQGYRLL